MFFIVGEVFGFINAGDNVGKITQLMLNASKTGVSGQGDLELSSLDLFMHNLTSDLITVLGGFLFSIISVIMVIYNAVSVGSIFGVDLTYATVTVLPHAITEYLASVLALAVAFIITKIEIKIIKNRTLRNTLNESQTELKDSLVLIIVIVILLAISAIIEAHITPIIAKWYFHL